MNKQATVKTEWNGLTLTQAVGWKGRMDAGGAGAAAAAFGDQADWDVPGYNYLL